jgi:Hypervirulence associated proteins TUDOR domain/Domain of unknown function DUF488
VSGRIIKVHTRDVSYKGYTHHASKDDPQYVIKSDKSDHVAMHKERPAALARVTETDRALPFFTIGHSTRPVVELADMLTAVEVGVLVDVRAVPRSRTNPQSNKDVRAAAIRRMEPR